VTKDDGLAGRVIVVTGAASGLGADAVDLMASRGAQVAVLDRDGAGAQRVASTLRESYGGSPLAIELDVASSSAVAAAFEEVRSSLGPVYGLVNSAGIRDLAGVLEISPEEWRRIIDVNLNGTFYCSQAAARQMVSERAGSIINVASVGGMVAFPARPGYTSTKAAVIGLTKSFARELGPSGVRANALCPGIIRTPMTESYFADATFAAALAQTIPIGRAGEPREVSELAAFLMTDAASLISGTAIPVDGAFLAAGNVAIVSSDSPFVKSARGGNLPSEQST
jgi:NAD(P)-dependent dehydrogenase (short-subunit alcohol dehydrogenase family)